MKKFLLILICFIFSAGLAFSDHASEDSGKYKKKKPQYWSGFFWLGEGGQFIHEKYKPGKFNQSGKPMPEIIGNPKKKILIIYNHGGGWGQEDQWKWGEQFRKLYALSKLSGVKVGDKEIIMWNNKVMNQKGGRGGGLEETVAYLTMGCGGPFPKEHTVFTPEVLYAYDAEVDKLYPQYHDCIYSEWKRYNFNWPNKNEMTRQVLEEFIKDGFPANNIFLTGVSSGGMDAFHLAGLYGNGKLLNAGIPVNMCNWDDTPLSAGRQWVLGQIKHEYNNSLPILYMNSDIDSAMCYGASYNWMEPILKDIPGVEMVKLPGYGNDKGHIMIDGANCKVQKKAPLKKQGGYINIAGGPASAYTLVEGKTRDKGKWGNWKDFEWGWNKVGIYENGEVIIDDGATAKKRKGWQDSHAFITSACFVHYHPQIIDFITRRMQ